MEPFEEPQRSPTDAGPIDARESAPAERPYRDALVLFTAALVLCVLGYLATAVPGTWFPRASVKKFPATGLVLVRGTGGLEQGELVITAVDAAGTALVTFETDFRSSDYRVIDWSAIDIPEQTKVSLLWRNDYAPGKLNSVPLTVTSGRLRAVSLANDPNWNGRIRGIALVIQGSLSNAVRISGVAAKPMGAVEVAGDRVREWMRFEGFTGTSINSVTGGADVQDLPLPVLLATTVFLAGLGWFGLARVRKHTAGLPSVLGMMFVAAWLVQDARWAWDLARQTQKTARLYSGHDIRAQHLAAEDGALFAFIENVRAKLPPTPTRVFMVADAHYFRGRGAYHLYPHNVHFDLHQNVSPPRSRLRPGDYLVVYQRRDMQFDPGAQRLRMDGGAPIPAELLLSESGAALFRIR